MQDFLHNEYKPEDEKLFKMLVELHKGGEGDCIDPITVSKYIETEYRKRVLAKVREILWDGLGKKAVRINYHKCEGWNDDDTMEMDTALVNRDDVLDLLTSLQGD